MGRPARGETSCSKGFIFILVYLLGHFPGVVALIGIPLHFHPDDHGRRARNETPYPAILTKLLGLFALFFLDFNRESFLFIHKGWFNTP